MITTETRNPRSMALDSLPILDVLRLMNDEDARVPLAVREALPAIAQAVERTVEALSNDGRLIYVGAGTSGRLAVLDAAECPPTFSASPDQVQAIIAGGREALTQSIEGAEDNRDQGAAEIAAREVSSRDVVMGLSANGGAPFVLGAVEEARRRGAATIGMACNRPAPLLEIVDVPIAVIVGPEVLTGSTRLKSGTAEKMVLNMISTATMVQLGKVHENLMIDVRPVNAKLRVRARRIIAAITGLSEEASADVLSQAGGEVKTAIFMALVGVEAEAARQRLAAAKGHLRRALESHSED